MSIEETHLCHFPMCGLMYQSGVCIFRNPVWAVIYGSIRMRGGCSASIGSTLSERRANFGSGGWRWQECRWADEDVGRLEPVQAGFIHICTTSLKDLQLLYSSISNHPNIQLDANTLNHCRRQKNDLLFHWKHESRPLVNIFRDLIFVVIKFLIL